MTISRFLLAASAGATLSIWVLFLAVGYLATGVILWDGMAHDGFAADYFACLYGLPFLAVGLSYLALRKEQRNAHA